MTYLIFGVLTCVVLFFTKNSAMYGGIPLMFGYEKVLGFGQWFDTTFSAVVSSIGLYFAIRRARHFPYAEYYIIGLLIAVVVVYVLAYNLLYKKHYRNNKQ